MNATEQIDEYLNGNRGAAPCSAFGSDPDQWQPYARALALVSVGYGEEPEDAIWGAAGAVVNADWLTAYCLLLEVESELGEDAPDAPGDWPDDWREQADHYNQTGRMLDE